MSFACASLFLQDALVLSVCVHHIFFVCLGKSLILNCGISWLHRKIRWECLQKQLLGGGEGGGGGGCLYLFYMIATSSIILISLRKHAYSNILKNVPSKKFLKIR